MPASFINEGRWGPGNEVKASPTYVQYFTWPGAAAATEKSILSPSPGEEKSSPV